ncbi:hypothetical protein DH2020_034292 [Rehmannia glutinosa]|uniref:SAM domain-containing protein n=1 Tax=Rehmannia glutinosa TaxID=99300 RepID=A0ABR0VD45_REHGL
MAPNSNSKSNIKASSSSQFLNVTFPIMDDDDFQDYPSPSFSTASKTSSHPPRLKPHSSTTLRPSEKLKKQKPINPGKENRLFHETEEADLDCGLDSIEPTLDLLIPKGDSDYSHSNTLVESKLLNPFEEEREKICDEEFYEGSSQLDVLLKLCADVDEQGNDNAMDYSEGKCVVLICCPICGADISGLSDDLRQIHTNECLDLVEGPTEVAATNDGRGAYQCPGQVLDDSPIKSARKVVDVSPVVEWLRNLGLAKYEEIFVRQEIDWDALQCLTEEDLCDIGITTLGPRKKILCALKELRNDLSRNVEPKTDVSRGVTDETKLGTNKLITDYFSDYQGLTRSFGHGMIYCSSITAKLVNLKIGIPWDKIQVLPLNQKTNIAGIDVTCFDANHCPGAIIILFEPPNGKPVLHTGDFRFCEDLAKLSILQACPIHTLILDTTYCDPQYDFPKQEAIIQFVIDAIQAEAFNPKTLFLIGSYTIGKERVFVEVAKALRKKVYVTAAKLRILECLGLQQEDMQWFTLNEQESHIHVVPMWSIASFKRMKHMSIQYMGRFSLIVAFSPTGWSFGKGKKSTGRRWQKGTIIRYEVPYSEHSSFTELKEFVKFISPVNIIPSVNNHGPDSQNSMVSQLLA